MDDPWAAGPSWSAPAEASTSARKDGESPSHFPPPTNFEVGDPWGAPPPTALQEEGQSQPQAGNLLNDGWGIEHVSRWAEEAERSLTPPREGGEVPPRPASPEQNNAQEAVWTLDSSPDRGVPSSPQHDKQSTEEPPFFPAARPSEFPTPPPSAPSFGFASLQHDLGSPSGSHRSHASQHSYHSPSHSNQEDSPPRSGLTNLHTSPSFPEEGFGGFSTALDGGDPWGGGGFAAPRDDWGDPSREDHRPDEVREGTEAENGGDNWGEAGPRTSETRSVRVVDEDDWEEAQTRMRLKEQRVPDAKIQELEKQWTTLAEAVMGLQKLEKPSEEEQRHLEEALRRLQESTAETLRSLGSIPSNINTYQPVISSLLTHERHVYALTRPNPTPSTSLLSVNRSQRTGRVDDLSLSSSSSPWLSRSRLGEPDPHPPEAPTSIEEAAKSRWSFWGRKPPPEKSLTTSGGGVLEVRPVNPEIPTIIAAPEMKAKSSQSSSIAPRSSSPAPSLPGSIFNDVTGQPPVSAAIPNPSQPSAVTRFFGRLSRKTSSQHTTDMDNGDFELTTDDFSFLDQVPSLSERPIESGVDDLLSIGTGRTKQIASLESMLTSTPTTLPAALAPPPRGPSAPAYARSLSNSSNSSRFVAKMSQPQASAIDLLGGLDFDGEMPSAGAAPAVSSQNMASSSSTQSYAAWDEFLAPAQAISSARRPTAAAPPAPAISTPPVPSPMASSSLLRARTADLASFGDLDSPHPSGATTGGFDDFGDFSNFGVRKVSHDHDLSSPFGLTSPPAAQPINASKQRTPHLPTPSHAKPALDHTPTINLIASASASKGRRWPAPPSPVGPVLEPPPKGGPPLSAGFPFLSPPPPSSRPLSRLGGSGGAGRGGGGGGSGAFGDLLGSGNPLESVLQPPSFSMTPTISDRTNTHAAPLGSDVSSGLALAPPRSSTPMSVQPPAPKPAPTPKPGTGLSAQDLSFFDNL